MCVCVLACVVVVVVFFFLSIERYGSLQFSSALATGNARRYRSTVVKLDQIDNLQYNQPLTTTGEVHGLVKSMGM